MKEIYCNWCQRFKKPELFHQLPIRKCEACVQRATQPQKPKRTKDRPHE